jgi:ribonuclease J
MKTLFKGGINQIGGNAVIVKGDHTRLLIDAGIAVTGDTCSVADLLNVDAVLLSHAHLDHYGQLTNLPENIPVFCSELTWRLIQATTVFSGKNPLKRQVTSLRNYEEISIGDLSVTPYPMDHSAPDSMSFLIRDSNKKIFYTGDFRSHGRRKKCFERLLANPPRNVDALLIEGTMLGREPEATPNEFEVEIRISDILTENNGIPFFLIAASQNIDRIVSCYKAAVGCGRIFVVDIYTAWILRQFRLGNSRSGIPDIDWGKVKVIANGATASRHYGILKKYPEIFGAFTRELYIPQNRITLDEIARKPERFFIKTSFAKTITKTCAMKRYGLIYSLWPGYLQDNAEISELRQVENCVFELVHAGGHALPGDIRYLIGAIKPQITVPVHTEAAEHLKNIVDNVKIVAVNSELEL